MHLNERLSLEGQLITALSRPDLSPDDASQVAELITRGGVDLDWALVVDQAAQHRVAPLLSWHLDRQHSLGQALPADQTALSTLRALRLYHAERNEVALSELDRVLGAARASDLAVLPRKGGHLAQRVYSEAGLRPMGDLDVLVAPEQAGQFVEVLTGLGYQQGLVHGAEVKPLGRRESVFWRLYGSDLPKFNKIIHNRARPVISIDVNVALVLPGQGYTLPVQELLDRSETADDDTKNSFLAPEDTVLDLAIHCFKNATGLRFMHLGKHRRLIKYVDIIASLSSFGAAFSWSTFQRRVLEYGVAEPAYYGLAHTDRLFPFLLPAELLSDLRGRCKNPDELLDCYGYRDLAEPRRWPAPFEQRFFSRRFDAEIPPSRSLV